MHQCGCQLPLNFKKEKKKCPDLIFYGPYSHFIPAGGGNASCADSRRPGNSVCAHRHVFLLQQHGQQLCCCEQMSVEMVELSVKAAQPVRTAGILQQNRVFLDFFWDLAKPDQEVRLKAVESLIQYLKTNNKVRQTHTY